MIKPLPAGAGGLPRSAEPDLARLDPKFATCLGFGTSQRLGVLPVCRDGDRAIVWLRAGVAWSTVIEVGAEFGTDLDPLVVPDVAFNRALQRAFESKAAPVDAAAYIDDAIDLEAAATGLPEPADLLDTRDDAPIIRLLNAVLVKAIDERASDIHVEPYETELAIRYRIDGMLRDMVSLPAALAGRIAARVKVMAHLNIAERRVPQDGRIGLRVAGRIVDVRVSTLPTHYGERVVLRILEKQQGPLGLDQIGMPADVRDRFERLIRSPNGILLVTGPTGSGKTTTLYAALQIVRRADVNIITLEDPVEYDLSGVAQCPVNTKTGMTFAKGLRAILRQDPDVVMVGEIRDLETAEIAVQASLTGHLVFSTLHTNDAVATITRLVDMGVEPYLAASSLIGVMGQRLVRRLCVACRRPLAPEAFAQLAAELPPGPVAVYEARGCERCGNSGYSGRTGIYELLVVDDALRHLIQTGATEQRLRETARANGMTSLWDAGVRKVLAGDTSLDEVLRVARSGS